MAQYLHDMKTLEITDFQTEFPGAQADYDSPCPDTEKLAAQGKRVMVYRNTLSGQFSLFVAPEGELTAGWVLAVEKKS